MLRGRAVAPLAIVAIIVGALVLASMSGWETRFPALWLPMWVFGIGLALSMRAGRRTMVGTLGRLCAVLGAVGLTLAILFRWLR